MNSIPELVIAHRRQDASARDIAEVLESIFWVLDVVHQAEVHLAIDRFTLSGDSFLVEIVLSLEELLPTFDAEDIREHAASVMDPKQRSDLLALAEEVRKARRS
jgi:hypothetical protein